MKTIITSLLLIFITTFSWGQNEKKLIRKGNKSYEQGNYQEAEIDYIKAVQSEDPTHKGLFNLGDALFQQDNYLEATAVFDSVATLNLDEETMSKVYYNLGNSLLKLAEDSAEIGSKVLPASIESYKNSLRINPTDYDAKYNLAYAQKLLEQQQQQQQQQDQKQDEQNQDDKQDQQGQQKDENKEQEDQDKEDQKDQQNDKRDNKGDQKQQGQPQQKEISKEDAERMLEALKNDEKKTLEKLKKIKAKAAKKSKSEKDW